MTMLDAMVPQGVSERLSPEERRQRILDAFERCILRKGFHGTSMQDVAQEARMSAGNLYRYFAAKDELVRGLTERDRRRIRDEFARAPRAAGLRDDFAVLSWVYLVLEPREKVISQTEIFAEATRNPAVHEPCMALQRDLAARITARLEEAKADGAMPGDVDCAGFASLMMAVADGFMQRRALMPDYDPTEGYRHMMTLIDAVVDGRLRPGAAEGSRPPLLP